MWLIIVILTIGLYNMFKNPQNLNVNKSEKIIFSKFLVNVTVSNNGEEMAFSLSLIDPQALDAALDAELEARPSGWLVVEPAGGLHVPLTDAFLTSDWLARRAEPLVLVARSGLGTLNHTLLSVEALAARGLRPRALLLVGPPHPSNCATLRARVACPVFELPHLAPLSSETVRSWAEASGLAQALA